MFKGEDDNIAINSLKKQPDISAPRWDQKTFEGRAKHFFSTVNPFNILISSDDLEKSRKIVMDYKEGKFPDRLTVGELWKAKEAFDSAYHPETGDKMFILGRMSSQVPCNMILNGGLLTFRSNFPSVVFWHWLNQSFNAVVNYTNRSGDGASNQRLLTSYACATTGAVSTALFLNSLVKNASGIGARLIPFSAVAFANAINIPFMRSKELQYGIVLRDDDGNEVGKSTYAAKLAISQVVLSRIAMAASTMVTVPLLMKLIENRKWFMRRKWLAAPIQTLIAGFTLAFSTPLGCAFFEQNASIYVANLEEKVRKDIEGRPNAPKVVYYNKGL
ncbi:sfxn-1.2 [Pristionchus pacificus]|nr:sfxn-1.2 [Pristionchus pacificus]